MVPNPSLLPTGPGSRCKLDSKGTVTANYYSYSPRIESLVSLLLPCTSLRVIPTWPLDGSALDQMTSNCVTLSGSPRPVSQMGKLGPGASRECHPGDQWPCLLPPRPSPLQRTSCRGRNKHPRPQSCLLTGFPSNPPACIACSSFQNLLSLFPPFHLGWRPALERPVPLIVPQRSGLASCWHPQHMIKEKRFGATLAGHPSEPSYWEREDGEAQPEDQTP